MLKAIGFWIEKLGDEEFPAPQEFIGLIPSNVRAQLTQYLDAGLIFRAYRGRSWCRFGCGVDHSRMGSKSLTDGVWLWPEGLSHYVRNHQIMLPEEFVTHALIGAKQWQPPENETVEFSFWVQWRGARRSPRLLELLRSAQFAAEAAVAEAKRKHIEFVIRDKGLSKMKCQWVRCTRKALIGRSICAEHSLSPMDNARFELALFSGLQECLRHA
jgi:hypothetical protein